MKKKVNLVIGSEGFVGKSFCNFLEQKGEEVRRFDLKRGINEDGRIFNFDFTDIDRVYFLAWEVGGSKYLYREDIQFVQLDSNLKLMLNIFPQLQAAKVPFLFISSQLAEEVDTVYGTTKRLGEVWTHLIDGVRVRLWNVYGGYEPPTERSHVVADFAWQALRTGEIRMLTTGEELRQFIYIDDVCHGFYSALNQKLPNICDISSFEWVPVYRVAEIIANLTSAKVVQGSKRGSTPITPMCGKVPGWVPQISLEEGLERMICSYKKML